MTCEEVRPRLSGYLDDELPPREADAVRQHLSGCEPCRALHTDFRDADREIREAVKDALPPAGFSARVAAAARPPASPWAKRLALAAAALALLLAGSAVWVNTLEAPPLVVAVHGAESFHADSLGALRVLLTHASSGSPVAQAAVRVYLAGKEVGKYATGRAGTIDGFFRVPDLADGSYPLRLEIESSAGNEVLTRTVTVRREYRLMLTADKPVYQPGQAIHMRALALNAFTLKPRAGDCEFEALDSKGNRIFSRKASLSEFGIASAELPLADEVNLGTYRLAVTASGLRQERTVEVARYVLPKFKVEVELDRPSYRPREVVRGTVRARYFTGERVQGRVRAKLLGSEVLSGSLREDGSWEFQAPAPGTDGLLEAEVTVTDTADHKETKTAAATVSREPLKAVLHPDGGATVSGVENTYYVLVAYPDGRPVKGDVSLLVNGTRVEAATDDLGVARFAVGPPFQVRLDRARDKAGNETREMTNLSSGATRDFAIQLDKAAYKAGETMTVRVLGRTGEPVYIDLVKGGQLLLARAIEGGELAVDLPPDLFGTVQVIAYRRSTAQPQVRLAYVNLPEGLRIRPRASKETFRPGEEMAIDLEVVDAKGQPIQAALGVSVVDEALFALVESKVASEKAWLSLAPELIDTRGFLKADVNEIYQGKNPNAQGFVSGNAPGARPGAILGNNHAARVAQIRRFVDRFNGVLVTIAQVSAVLLGILFFVILLGRPLVDLCGRRRQAQVPLSTVILIFVGGFLLLLLGSMGGAAGVLIAGVVGAYLIASIYATAWWFGRGRVLAGVACLALVLAPVVLLTAPVGGRADLSGLVLEESVPARGSGWARKAAELRAPAARRSAPAPLPPVTSVAPAPRAYEHLLSPLNETPTRRETRSERGEHEKSTGAPARIREYFPETLFWAPQVITDEKGRARLAVPGADSITSWRMLASAVSRGGALGFEQAGLKVFQEFFVDIDFPVALTKGDRVHVPVAVYNYLKEPQAVTVRAQKEPWFELLDEEAKSIALKAGEVSVVYFGLRVKEHGKKTLTVFADGVAKDAIRRSVEVMEKGREVPISAADRVTGRKTFTVEIPAGAIEGASVVFARITPGPSELVQGLAGLVRMPYG
jgi:hypothetical protein